MNLIIKKILNFEFEKKVKKNAIKNIIKFDFRRER